MSAVVTQAPPASRAAVRNIVFPILAGLFALGGWFFLEGLTEGLMPWVIIGCPGCSPDFDPEARRWFGAEHAAIVGILFSGSLVALLRRPQSKPLLLQYYVVGHILFLLGLAAWQWQPLAPPMKPTVVVAFLVVLGLLVFTYPDRRALLDVARPQPASRLLLAATLVAVLALAPSTWQALVRQVQEQGAMDRWAEAIDLSVLLVMSGLLAATRRPGWRELGILTSVAYLYLGLAALTVPDQMGSWGTLGGGMSLLGGIVYLVATTIESRVRPAGLGSSRQQ